MRFAPPSPGFSPPLGAASWRHSLPCWPSLRGLRPDRLYVAEMSDLQFSRYGETNGGRNVCFLLIISKNGKKRTCRIKLFSEWPPAASDRRAGISEQPGPKPAPPWRSPGSFCRGKSGRRYAGSVLQGVWRGPG